ncbi:MAG: cupin domain-containing protein [Natronomonas sp.]
MASDRKLVTELAGEAFELADLVDYQDGSIVSRTIVDEETVTLTAFAFDDGQSLSEHTAPHDALLQVVDGTGAITVEDETMDVKTGEAIVLPADVPHAVKAVGRFKMFLTMIR